MEDDSNEEEDFFLRGPCGPRFGPSNDKIKQLSCLIKIKQLTTVAAWNKTHLSSCVSTGQEVSHCVVFRMRWMTLLMSCQKVLER